MKNRCFYNLCIKTSGKPQKIPGILFRIGDFMYWTDSVRWNNKKRFCVFLKGVSFSTKYVWPRKRGGDEYF